MNRLINILFLIIILFGCSSDGSKRSASATERLLEADKAPTRTPDEHSWTLNDLKDFNYKMVECREQNFSHISVDYKFLEENNIDILAGRNFSEAFLTDSIRVIISEELANKIIDPTGQNEDFDIDDLIGGVICPPLDLMIIGVVEGFVKGPGGKGIDLLIQLK